MVSERCENCLFFKKKQMKFHPPFGACRRYPPPFCVGINWRGIPGGWSFPKVKPSDWCGEWQPKSEPKELPT